MPSQPAAFVSYVRFNDQHDDGWVSEFCRRLSAEVQVQLGEEFPIFQDRKDIAWGESWQQRIDHALDTVTLLLVILTPGFFRSSACKGEVERFLERERELGRDDLILPLYYVNTPELEDPERRDADELARVLASRQFADWRHLRFESLSSPEVRRAVAQLATRMCDTFWRSTARLSSGSRERVDQAARQSQYAETVRPAEVTARIDPQARTPSLPLSEPDIRIVPVLQKAAAGQRIVAGEDVRDYLPLPAWYVRSDQVFAFEVEGDSMTGEDGVLDGDLVIVDRDPTWVNGDMVVVSVGDHEREVVVRRLWRDGDSFRLQSSNPAYEAAILRVEDDPIVLGKVIGVARWHIKRGRRHAEPPH